MRTPLPEKLKEELALLYRDLACAQSSLSATCHQCGACCNFREYDHELWVTNLELAYLIDTEGARTVAEAGVCPYMENNRCTARIGRTLGCRVFLCEQNAVEMEELHEVFFNRLRALAKKYNIELEYGEFIRSMKDL